ncbi:AraC family transcriptional regulator [Flavobacterium geliluteum]|uniref:AraC family transcriptional regulator n=1 Tax=Flavobacterium geliluteum TaxID=2816120 RepID=A0A941AVB1_9FLAO|nr:AraC family transcriptional regulator [Flavobacterium geliluteum]MBP4137244.1 AraC family transcriptional regulator [Flavobacterium geliluteum]
MIRKYLFLLSICLGDQIYGQEIHFKIPDTLRNKSYEYLFNRIEESENDRIKQSLYLKFYLAKSKLEKNWKEEVNSYKNYVHHSPEKMKLIYTDSMIYTAKKSKDNALIGSAYLSKGIVYYSLKSHDYALDNYLIANSYISKTDDQYLTYKTKYNIALIKYYLGFYDETISLLKECIAYFKENNNNGGYLNSLHSLGLCYNRIGNYGLCTQINRIGLLEGKRLADTEMREYFIISEGVNQYFLSNYTLAINKINYALPFFQKNKDFANETVGYFYIGKSYWNLKNYQKAIPYFKKVDAIFNAKGYIRHDLRNNYELLIKYYKFNKNPELQLHYIQKLLKVDSTLTIKYKYLSEKIHKEYDTKQLLLQKNKIEKLLHRKERDDFIHKTIIIFLTLSVAFLIYKHNRNRKIYRQRFEDLMKKNHTESKIESKSINYGIKNINPDTVASILKQLEKFEKDKMFLRDNLTETKLAISFDSNIKYVSKVIAHHRGKKFVKYINDLKVDYLISLLKEDKKFQLYNNIALAKEAGFSTTERFAKAFFSRTGMPVSFFIKELRKE